MARYKATLIYDGTQYLGFQRQAEGSPASTIQVEIENSLRNIGWQGESILAAGRTDAGVHAAGQVVAFDLEWKHTNRELMAAINHNLPLDIAVSSILEAAQDFHPRFDALSRKYQYRTFCSPVRDPLRERYAWRIWPELEHDRIRKAAVSLIGKHDFRNFGRALKPGSSTIREVRKSAWKIDRIYGIYEVEANAFLYHMVRRIVKLLIAIGHSKFSIEELEKGISNNSSILIQGIAPAHGLILVRVEYPLER